MVRSASPLCIRIHIILTYMSASLPSPSSGQSSRLPPPPPTSSRTMLPPVQSMFTQPQLGYEERAQNVQPMNTLSFHSNTMATCPARVQEQEFQVTPSESVAGAKSKYNTRRSGRHKILSDFLGFVPTDWCVIQLWESRTMPVRWP